MATSSARNTKGRRERMAQAMQMTRKDADPAAALREQYDCGPVQLAGNADGLYQRHLVFDGVIDPSAAGPRERIEAFARSVRDVLSQRWVRTERTYERENPKRIYYLSMEFLIGRSLANNVMNLLLDPLAKQVVAQQDLDWLGLLEQEPDSGLGNGGLGRLAACFLDSMATMELPAMGYGLRYEYGMFRQSIEDGWQRERPDHWLRRRDARGGIVDGGALSRRLDDTGSGVALRAGVLPGRLLARRPRTTLPAEQRRLERAAGPRRHPAERYPSDDGRPRADAHPARRGAPPLGPGVGPHAANPRLYEPHAAARSAREMAARLVRDAHPAPPRNHPRDQPTSPRRRAEPLPGRRGTRPAREPRRGRSRAENPDGEPGDRRLAQHPRRRCAPLGAAAHD